MPEPQGFSAQLVMRREDGRSILEPRFESSGGATGSLDVSEDRAKSIRERLEGLGFTVAAGNLNTLSLTGPPDLFREVFGLAPGADRAESIPAELRPFVADVFVTPSPDYFQ